MKIFVNETERDVAEKTTGASLADQFKPGADLVIVNGFPASRHTTVEPGDRVVLIKRGEAPPAEELEALLTARHTPGVHQRIKSGHVGIAGLGGLGSHAAVALARVGVGRLTLVDFDVVEPSNLNRQHYYISQIGTPKAQALAETLRQINPYVEIDAHALRCTPGNVAEIFAGCDVVVEAFDVAEEKAMLVERALADLPGAFVVAASGVAGHGPTDTITTHRVGDRLIVVGDLKTEARQHMGLMAPRVGVAAHAQANVALRILLGEEV